MRSVEFSSPDRPLVSVVIPTYDRPARLVKAVRSVADQTYPAIELIVVDDASPTPAEEVLPTESMGDLRWRCFRHDTNRGANAARNTGIEAANGEIIAFHDDDDEWLSTKLEAQVSLFEDGGSDVGVALVGQRNMYEDEVTAIRKPAVEGNATPKLLEGKAGGTFSTIAVRRPVIERAGLPDERLPAWQDREWLLRLSRHCEFAVDRRPLAVSGSGEYGQIGDQFEAKRDVSYPLFVEKHRDLAAEHGLEREFVTTLTANLTATGLRAGFDRDARRLAMKTIRLDPLLFSAWICFFLSLTPPSLYRTLVRFRRRIIQLKDGPDADRSSST